VKAIARTVLVLGAAASVNAVGADEARPHFVPERLARVDVGIVVRNAPQPGTAAANVGATRRHLTLTVPLGVPADPIPGVELADSIDPFVAAVGLTGQGGALVFTALRRSAAARAGLAAGDLIVTAAGEPVRDADELLRRLRELRAETVALEVIRMGEGPADLVARLREVAASGNRDATLALGDVGLFNLDGRREPAAAEEHYRRAYALGDARAAYRLGTMYATGTGVAVDLAVATRWYRTAAEAGLPAAQHALGLAWWNGRYWTGQALVADRAEAVRLFHQAADRGYAPSYLYLGLAHELGLGVDADAEAARRWYDKAAAAGDVEAMLRLSAMAEGGEGADAGPERALELLRAAAQHGSVEANRRLGEKYWRGEGVPQHPLKAVAHLEVAAAKGDTASMTLMAQILLSGHGITRDPADAIGWYFRAYQAGDADAGYALALAHADGIGVAQDLGKVAGFMLEAIRRGSRAALAEMKGNAEAWDMEIREDMQELLKAYGFYTGEIDGVFGPATHRALDAAAGG
jgi:uncharacterized protein